jgi:hypothetical protein
LCLRHLLAFSACQYLPPSMPVSYRQGGGTSTPPGPGCLPTHSRNVPLIRGTQRLSQVPSHSIRCRATVYDSGGAQTPSPITVACMLLSSQETLSASSTTTISELTTFTCVAARYLLTTGFTSFVTATDAV